MFGWVIWMRSSNSDTFISAPHNSLTTRRRAGAANKPKRSAARSNTLFVTSMAFCNLLPIHNIRMCKYIDLEM